MLTNKTILGVGVTNATKLEVLEYLFDIFEKAEKKVFIVTPNPEILVYSVKHPAYKAILNKAELALPDGIGVMTAGLILKKRLKQRISGIDFMESICKEGVRKGVSIGLLGGGPGVAEKAADCLRKKYPGIKIVYVTSEWNDGFTNLTNFHGKTNNSTQKQAEEKTKKDEKSRGVPRDVPRSSATNVLPTRNSDIVSTYIDILFVAFGHPKQEEWIAENLSHLPVKVACGVGGAFDYISGNVPRAPKIVRNLGFEWLFRLILQPWRWRRQIALIEFCWLVLKEKFIGEKNGSSVLADMAQDSFSAPNAPKDLSANDEYLYGKKQK